MTPHPTIYCTRTHCTTVALEESEILSLELSGEHTREAFFRIGRESVNLGILGTSGNCILASDSNSVPLLC